MAQITTKIYQVSCIYDFARDGGAITPKNLGIAIRGGDTITAVYYRVISTIVTASVNIDIGYGFVGGTGMINPADTVAVLNAAMAVFKQNTVWTLRNTPVTSTNDFGIYLTNPSVITAGSILFSFTVMQHPM